jgi:hypothetical protein
MDVGAKAACWHLRAADSSTSGHPSTRSAPGRSASSPPFAAPSSVRRESRPRSRNRRGTSRNASVRAVAAPTCSRRLGSPRSSISAECVRWRVWRTSTWTAGGRGRRSAGACGDHAPAAGERRPGGLRPHGLGLGRTRADGGCTGPRRVQGGRTAGRRTRSRRRPSAIVRPGCTRRGPLRPRPRLRPRDFPARRGIHSAPALVHGAPSARGSAVRRLQPPPQRRLGQTAAPPARPPGRRRLCGGIDAAHEAAVDGPRGRVRPRRPAVTGRDGEHPTRADRDGLVRSYPA